MFGCTLFLSDDRDLTHAERLQPLDSPIQNAFTQQLPLCDGRNLRAFPFSAVRPSFATLQPKVCRYG
jgi:hypothetical protein